jgi:hypothetical protein
MDLWLIILLAVLAVIVVAFGTLLILSSKKPAALEKLASSKVGIKFAGLLMKNEKIRDKAIDVAAQQMSTDPNLIKQTAQEELNLGRQQTRQLDKQLNHYDSNQIAEAIKKAEAGEKVDLANLTRKKQLTPEEAKARNLKKQRQREKAKAARKQRKRNK